jgi:hypothetical protein
LLLRDKTILLPVLDVRRTSPLNMEFLTPGDIEQQIMGLPHDDNNIIIPSTSRVVTKASPRGPRPLIKSPNRPLPLPPSVPLVKPQQDDMVVQMEQIRNQMTKLEENPGPTQHIILNDLQKQMDWFKSQIEKKKSSSLY